MLSLGRGFAAYLLSLTFTLIYGTVSAHNRRAEAVMVPVLDVLQAIPVLGFMPGVVLALVALSPNHQLGLEAACIVLMREQVLKLDLFRFVMSRLQAAPRHELPKEIVEEELVMRLLTRNIEPLCDTIVSWGRSAELFRYSPTTETLYLSDAT